MNCKLLISMVVGLVALVLLGSMVYFKLFSTNTYIAYNWGEVLELPPKIDMQKPGKQTLHFSAVDKPYTDDPNAVQFVEKNLKNAKALTSDAETLHFASDQVTIDGEYIELGVCSGKTINFIAALNPNKVIHGFDSFEGLPEDWNRGNNVIAKKGTFGLKNKRLLPAVLRNVTLHQGLFEKSLPEFVSQVLKDKPIAFLHMDADLYSSTKTGLNDFKNNIVPGTIIIFDEYYNYPEYEKHEYQAFLEFLNETGYKVDYLAFNKNLEQVVLRIKK